MQNSYQLIVIGAGPGGYVAAISAAQQGLKVAVIEKDRVGGTCLNRGCIPTKAMLKSTELYREMQECSKFGIVADGVRIDMDALYARRDTVVAQLRDGVAGLLKANKIDVITGEAQIVRPGVVKVYCEHESKELLADDILIAAGSVPAMPPIEGIDLPGVVTSDDLLTGSAPLPKRLLIIGGGVIGVEFASMYQALGVHVTIVEALERLIPTLDREISQNLTMLLKKRGIAVFTGALVKRIVANDDLTCHFVQKGAELSEAADQILVSVGRRCHADSLVTADVPLEIERGQIMVNENFQTTVPHIYAIGDIVHGSIQLAHAASAQGERAVKAICGHAHTGESMVVPSCIYTDPEIASIGLSADEAKAQGIAVRTGKALMSANAKHVIEGADRGFIKLVFDAQSDILLGAQLLCPRATDLIAELANAVTNKLTRAELASVIRPHPTFCEAVTEAVMDVEGNAVHAMPSRR